jgi:hypothetical protein
MAQKCVTRPIHIAVTVRITTPMAVAITAALRVRIAVVIVSPAKYLPPHHIHDTTPAHRRVVCLRPAVITHVTDRNRNRSRHVITIGIDHVPRQQI